jgi:Helix-turn-helix domain
MMAEENRAAGEIFRLKRAEMNLSLKEVENATSIRTTYLQAIEDGLVGQMISPVYAKGFIIKYAKFLSLNPDQILRDHPTFFRPPEKQEFAYGIGTLEVRGGGAATNSKRLPNWVWTALAAGLLCAAYYLAKVLGVF